MTPRLTSRRLLVLCSAASLALAGCGPQQYPLATSQPQPAQTAPGAVDQSWPTSDERLSPNQRVEMQRLLNALGYPVGPADGAVGAQTRSAIRDYQAATRRRADGVVSTELLASLRADGQRNGIRLANTTPPVTPTATSRTPVDTTPTTRRPPGGRPDNPPEPTPRQAALTTPAPEVTPPAAAPTARPEPVAAPEPAPEATPTPPPVATNRPAETPEPTFVRRRAPTESDTDSGGWN